MNNARKPVLILGVGNILYGDDGVGVEVVQELGGEDAHPDVEYIDGGVGGYGLISFLEGRKKVVIVDAANMGSVPGDCRLFAPEDVELTACLKPVSLHQTNILDVVRLAQEAGVNAEITFIGVQPASAAPGIGLSQELRGKKEFVKAFVRDYVIHSTTPVQ
ncbi:MAG TPA: hydrogenase maturation protease [bacterium]|nr:hydrogenase maturation protease [bacterium]